jgi:hypothetical protein
MVRNNSFGRYDYKADGRNLLREIYMLMENTNVLPFLWNLNTNNGIMNMTFYNRRPIIYQNLFMRIIYAFDRILRNNQMLEYLFNQDNHLTDAYINCLNNGTIDPMYMTLYLFRELY